MKSKLEQTTTRNNIRIFGLGEENNENCYDVVLRLCDELNLDVKRNELDRVHGVGRARNMTHSSNNPVHPRPMTVKLTGHQSKLRWLDTVFKNSGVQHFDMFKLRIFRIYSADIGFFTYFDISTFKLY